MKKAIAWALVMLCIIAASNTGVSAKEERTLWTNTEKEIVVTQFEDGSYLTCLIKHSPSEIRSVQTGEKVYTYYNTFDQVEWKATLEGTFTYTGIVAVCTDSALSFDITNNNWSVTYQNASRSGDTAYGDFTMAYKVLGITIRQITEQMTLTCDPNGNLS